MPVLHLLKRSLTSASNSAVRVRGAALTLGVTALRWAASGLRVGTTLAECSPAVGASGGASAAPAPFGAAMAEEDAPA